MNAYKRAIVATGVVLLIGCSREPEAPPAAAQPKPAATISPWGFDLTAMDRAVKPGDDFYNYANGQWAKTAEIPADLTRWGAFTQLALEAEKQVHGILESLAPGAAGGAEQKVGDFYRSYLDVDAIEKAGLEPARAALGEIAAARTHADIAALFGRPDLGLECPVNVHVTIDEKNPDRYISGVTQSGIGLPERDYYLNPDAKLAELRKKYLAHIERMLALGGEKDAARQAKSILDLETQIAKLHWPIAKRRERELTYNLRTREELEGLARNYPWKEMLTAAGLNEQREFVVSELDAVQALARFVPSVPVNTWKSYLTYHFLVGHAGVLPKAIDDERFDFYGRTLNGQPQQRGWPLSVRP